MCEQCNKIYNENSIIKEVVITRKNGIKFMSFECGDCENKTHNQPPIGGLYYCGTCSKRVLITPSVVNSAITELWRQDFHLKTSFPKI